MSAMKRLAVLDHRGGARLAIVATLAILAGVMVLHREVLFSGSVYHMDDAADGYYPSHAAIWRALSHGHLPIWERGAWCGFPLIADPYYGTYYLPNLIFPLFGMVRGLGISIVLHTLLSACGMFVLLRRRRLPVGPALLGAVSLGFCSFIVERVRHLGFAQLFAWLPWILAGVEGYLATHRRRELLLCATAAALALLCGSLPLSPFFCLALLAYLAPRLLDAPGRRALPGLLFAAGIGALLAMAQIVPTVAHLPESPRSLGTDYAFASSYAWPDVSHLMSLLAPDWLGGEPRGTWLGAFNHWEMAGYYSGALAVLLAPFALLRRRWELGLLFSVSLLGIALAFGDKLPLHGFFFRHVPLYAALRCPTRALVMGLLALPILAAEGLTFMMERAQTFARRRGGMAIGIGLCGLFLAAGGIGFVLLRRPVPGLSRMMLAHRHAAGHLVGVVGAGLGVLALLFSRALRPGTAGMALALVALCDLVAIDRGYVQPQPADFARGTERFAAVDWLFKNQLPALDYGAEPPKTGDRFVPDAYGPFRLLNLGLTYDRESASGYDSYSIFRYVNFLQVLNTGAPYPFPRLKDDLAAGFFRRLHSPLLDLLGVRWFIGENAPGPGWVERFRPAPGAPLAARYEAYWDPRLAVYENPHPLPRAFVVYAAQVLPDDRAQAEALATLDPRRIVLLDRPPVHPLSAAGPAANPPLTPAHLTHAAADRLTFEADAAAPGVLVVSEAYYPGFSATLDGAPAPLLRADYAFRGVSLPAGHHVVGMRYRPRPVALGLSLSVLGLLLLLYLTARPGRW